MALHHSHEAVALLLNTEVVVQTLFPAKVLRCVATSTGFPENAARVWANEVGFNQAISTPV